jgi:tRNA(Met) cytidine acetyltransferase
MPPRALHVLRGDAESTRAQAAALVAALPAAEVLWVGPDAPSGHAGVRPRDVARRLGAGCDAVVLDLHAGLDADLIGQCHGFVRGGGALILRLWPEGAPPPATDALCVHPFTPADVGRRFEQRFERVLPAADPTTRTPLAPAVRAVTGTAEQAAVVSRLCGLFQAAEPRCASLLADRGRGKSSALGLALRAVADRRVAVTASQPEAAAEVLRFAGDAARFVPLEALLEPESPAWDVIVVDEAAQLPVPVLQRLAERHPQARMAFATTAQGYEGTGRGFVLRFLAWAARQARPLERLTLRAPIRWGAYDPLERAVSDLLLLDAAPAAVDAHVVGKNLNQIEHIRFDRDALAADEATLRAFFGLLVHAHYRTTPGDLHRMLDAPNLSLHALLWRGRVVAASLVAREGGLPAGLCADMAAGRTRIRGHALADTLVSHAGHPEAGTLSMVRSVRIAAHPDLRRLGLARRLVEAVHATEPADLYGTLFGATPELLAFRRALGYRLVRVGVSRGARSGEPAAVMVRPASPAAEALSTALEADLARALPAQLALQAAAGELVLDPALVAAFTAGLPERPPPSPAELAAAVETYLSGPAPYEGAAWAVRPWLAARGVEGGGLSPREKTLLTARVLRGDAWRAAAREAGYESNAAAMRALRPALRALRVPGSGP